MDTCQYLRDWLPIYYSLLRVCVCLHVKERRGGMEESVVHHPLPPAGNHISELAVVPRAPSS